MEKCKKRPHDLKGGKFILISDNTNVKDENILSNSRINEKKFIPTHLQALSLKRPVQWRLLGNSANKLWYSERIFKIGSLVTERNS